jgi:hypothetical protein
MGLDYATLRAYWRDKAIDAYALAGWPLPPEPRDLDPADLVFWWRGLALRAGVPA